MIRSICNNRVIDAPRSKALVTFKSLGIAHPQIVNYGKRGNRFSSAFNAFPQLCP